MKIIVTVQDLKDNRAWEQFCKDQNIPSDWDTKLSDEDFKLDEEDAKKYGFVQASIAER